MRVTTFCTHKWHLSTCPFSQTHLSTPMVTDKPLSQARSCCCHNPPACAPRVHSWEDTRGLSLGVWVSHAGLGAPTLCGSCRNEKQASVNHTSHLAEQSLLATLLSLYLCQLTFASHLALLFAALIHIKKEGKEQKQFHPQPHLTRAECKYIIWFSNQ